MYTWFHSLLFTLPIVSEKISQKTNRLRLKKFRREKKKKRVLRSWQGVYMTSVPSFWVELRKHRKLPGASVSLKLHKFSLIFGLLLEVSGREVKGDLQPCDIWFGWQWEHNREEREKTTRLSPLQSTGSKAWRNWCGCSVVKNLPAMQETQVYSSGQEDPLDEGMATHYNILAWRNPWTKETGRLHSIGSQRVGHDWSDWALTHRLGTAALSKFLLL